MAGFLGVNWDEVLLILTTVVSLEAIYLAIFIQMTVNRTSMSLREVEADVDEIQKDVDEIQEDIDEIQEDVDEIQEDVAEQTEKDKAMENIKHDLAHLMQNIAKLGRLQDEEKANNGK